MQQDNLFNINDIFKNVKRKSAIQAKEKITGSNITGIEPLKIPKKENDIIKPMKLKREREKEINFSENEDLNDLPQKRKSIRNKKISEKNLIEFNNDNDYNNKNKIIGKNKNLLENIIEKRKKKEEEIKPLIQEAKLRMLNKNTNKDIDDFNNNIDNCNHNDNCNDDNFNENTNKDKTEENNNFCQKTNKRISNNKIFPIKIDTEKEKLKGKDISDKTKNIVQNIMTRRKRARNEEINNLDLNDKDKDKEKEKDSSISTLQLKNKLDSKINSAEKTYMSSDVLDNYEENIMFKNKQKMTKRNFLNLNNTTLSDLALKDLMNNLSKKPEENLHIINDTNYNNSISEKNEIENNSINNLNNFKKDQKLINNINNNKNLLLSCEANGNKKRQFEISTKTQMIINKLKEEKRENNFKRDCNKVKDSKDPSSNSKRNKSESSFSLKFKYEDLIKEERELNLPVKYKYLLNQFSQLDQTLNFFKLNNKQKKMPNFEEIKSSIENTYRK